MKFKTLYEELQREANSGGASHPDYDRIVNLLTDMAAMKLGDVLEQATRWKVKDLPKEKSDIQETILKASNGQGDGKSLMIDDTRVLFVMDVKFYHREDRKESDGLLIGAGVKNNYKPLKDTHYPVINAQLSVDVDMVKAGLKVSDYRPEIYRLMSHEAVHVIQSMRAVIGKANYKDPNKAGMDAYLAQRIEVQANTAMIIKDLKKYRLEHPEATFDEALGQCKRWKDIKPSLEKIRPKAVQYVMSKLANAWNSTEPK